MSGGTRWTVPIAASNDSNPEMQVGIRGVIAATSYFIRRFFGDPNLNKFVFRDIVAKVCTGSALTFGECDHLDAPCFM